MYIDMYILQKKKVSFSIIYLSLIEFRKIFIIIIIIYISSILTLISFFEFTYNHINKTANKEVKIIYIKRRII